MDTCRIAELGRRFGLSRSTLLYYDRIGLLCPGGRSRSDYREYTQEDAKRLERICFFREAGLGLAEIADLLDGERGSSAILEERLRAINQEMAELRAQQRLVAGMLRTVSSGPEASRLDRDLWSSLQKASALDDAALRRWHSEFERRAPGAHHDFLLGLGLDEKEAIQIRMLTRNVRNNRTSMEYFYELFDDLPRQAPGCAEATRKALRLLENLPAKPRVLDIGCGSGAQTRILARELDATILAIDNHRPVLDRLDQVARREALAIEARELSMFDMPFDEASFDLLWGEGALFIIGLDRGLAEFRRFLAPGGHLAFTEMCWLESDPPAEVKAWLEEAYPDIQTLEGVRGVAEFHGYEEIGSFVLPDTAWLDEYYAPMLARLEDLKIRNAGIAEAEAVYARLEREVDMFWRYSRSYGYVFFVLRRMSTAPASGGRKDGK